MTDTNRTAGRAGQDESMVESLRQRAIEAYDSTRESTSDATRRAGDAIGEAPLVALGAGIAVGAILAALLPISRREHELLGPYADRVTGAARDAAGAAREAGSEKLRELGLTPDAVAEKASAAAKASARAAAGKFREDAAKS
jgi:hypothetical protein